MSELTVSVPTIGQIANVKFKEPYTGYVKGILSTSKDSHHVEVVSVTSMEDIIRVSKRDVFMDTYNPVGLSLTEYSQDLLDKIPLVTFANKDADGFERLVRVPLNYVESISPATNIDYAGRYLIVDLGKLPVELDLSPIFTDLADYVASRTGVDPEITDTTLEEFEAVEYDEFRTRETIRTQSVKVNKTLHVRYEELSFRYDSLVKRLDELGISLEE